MNELTLPVPARPQAKKRLNIFNRLLHFFSTLYPANWFNDFREIDISLDEL
jgi:hypothetical protein